MRQYIKSWIKLIRLNIPYINARLAGYKYYYELPIAIVATPNIERTFETEQNIKQLGSDVRIVRRAKRMNTRAFRYNLYATFKNEEDAMAFKLIEGISGELKKFR
jgi:hypothetical protein